MFVKGNFLAEKIYIVCLVLYEKEHFTPIDVPTTRLKEILK